MANKLIPWQRYLSDIAHKYVGYPDEEGGDMGVVYVDVTYEALPPDYVEVPVANMSPSEILEEVKAGNTVLVRQYYNDSSEAMIFIPGDIYIDSEDETATYADFISFNYEASDEEITNLGVTSMRINNDKTCIASGCTLQIVNG